MMANSNPWLIFHRKKGDAPFRLFCFHYAGGSASAFRDWTTNLHPAVELIAVQMPGREGRFAESGITDFEELINTLVEVMRPYLDKPYVVFGHSMGALISFELLRALKRRNASQPLMYIPSGRRAPHLPFGFPPVSSLSDEKFVAELMKRYEKNLRFVVENKELREIFIPLLRADYTLMENYRFEEGERLDCPLVAVAGTDEPDISEQDIQCWSTHTTGEFHVTRFPGDHFYIRSSQAPLLHFINDRISSGICR